MAKKKNKLTVEEFLSGISEGTIDTVADPEIKEPNKTGVLDYFHLKTSCDEEASRIVNSLIDFYLDDKMKELSYIKSRIKDDISTISDLIFNMKSSEHALIKLLEVIDEGGAFNARNFEMLARLQSSKMEIVKHYEAVKTNLENNYKSLKKDYREILMLSDEGDASVEGFGHKSLLDQLKSNFDEDEYSEIPENDVDEIEYDKDEFDEDIIEEIPKEQITLPPGVKIYDRNRT